MKLEDNAQGVSRVLLGDVRVGDAGRDWQDASWRVGSVRLGCEGGQEREVWTLWRREGHRRQGPCKSNANK